MVGALIKEDVLARPLRHVAVSLALAWRAIFVGKLWGLVALGAFVFVCVRRPAVRGRIVILSLPAWFMLAFYASIYDSDFGFALRLMIFQEVIYFIVFERFCPPLIS